GRGVQEGAGQLPHPRSVPVKPLAASQAPDSPGGSRMSRPAFALVLACLLAGAACSQDKKDPLQSFEPKSKPGAGQKFLAKSAGEGDVTKPFHPRRGEPVKATGECKQTMIHDGRFLQSDFTFKTDAGKTTGLGLIGFEPDTGLFTSVWTDSRQTRMSARQSEEKFDGSQSALL